MFYLLYNVVGILAAPLLALGGQVQRMLRRRHHEGWLNRLGRLPAPLVNACRGRRVIWIHAASVGEVQAAGALVAALRRGAPGAVLVISHWTRSGGDLAARLPGLAGTFYVPFDYPWLVDRVIAALRPDLFCSIDTELWPNLIRRCRAAGVRVALANGRISDRSLRRIRSFGLRWFYGAFLPQLDRCLMQSALDRERLIALGAPAERVVVAGNVKFDEPFPTVDSARLAWWRKTLGLAAEAPVLLAGSTAPGENEAVLAAFETVRRRHPAARLILVPRLIERSAEVVEAARRAGHAVVRRTELPGRAARSLAEQAVVVVDTIGELSELYAVATVVFVGRTLEPLGGSNVMQAAAQGKPVLVGPHVANFRDSVALLERAGALWFVHDAGELAEQALALLDEPADLAAAGRRARAAVDSSRGAAERTASALLELIDA